MPALRTRKPKHGRDQNYARDWPARVAAMMGAEVSAEVERQNGTPVNIDATIMQRVLESHVRAQLEALADLRVSLG